MREENFDLSTTERQLLYDIRSEMRKTNELLTQLLEALHPIARDVVLKEVKVVTPKVKSKTITQKDKPKRGINNAKNK